MSKITLAAAVAFVLATQNAHAQTYGYGGNSYDNSYGTTQNSPKIYAPDGTYLGNLNSNQHDPHSAANRYGQYGSPYSPNSINNRHGQYGSPYSPYSVKNRHAR